MEILILGINVVFPLLFIMSAGYLSKLLGLINDNGVGAVNRLLFWVFLPVLLFVSIYNTNIKEAFSFRLVVFTLIGIGIVFLLSLLFVPKLERDILRRGVIIQALVRGNEVYFGFPILAALIGEEYLGIMAIVVAASVPVHNAFSVMALELHKPTSTSKMKIFVTVLQNPLIIATIIASFTVLLEIQVPTVIMTGVTSLSKVATPLALFLLGASFSFRSTRGYFKEVVAVTFIRLIFIPGIVLLLSYYLGFESYEIVILFVTFAVPTAVSSYSMARELGGDYELASQIVVYTSTVDIVTIFLWTIVLSLLHIV